VPTGFYAVKRPNNYPAGPGITGLLVVALLAGCAGAPERRAPERRAPEARHAPSGKAALADSDLVRNRLYAQYRLWKGVRYRIGGMGRDGIDCSGFVFVTFRTQFGIVLPRTTERQVEIGKGIGRSDLRPGDLVFFKTGWFERHVGIYLGHGRFLHASTSRGVMISGLDDEYWKSAYWKARRVT